MNKFILPILLVLYGCSNVPHKYLPRESQGTLIYTNKGDAIATVSNERGAIIPVIEDEGEDIELTLVVSNWLPKEIVLRDLEFSMSVSDDGQSWKPLKTYGSQEYFSKYHEEADSSVWWTETIARANANNSSWRQAYSNGTYSGNLNGYSVSGRYNETTNYYDPVAAQTAWESARRTIDAAKSKHGKRLSDLGKFLMYEERIPPGQMGGGLVFFKRKDGRFYKLETSNPISNGVSVIFERVRN